MRFFADSSTHENARARIPTGGEGSQGSREEKGRNDGRGDGDGLMNRIAKSSFVNLRRCAILNLLDPSLIGCIMLSIHSRSRPMESRIRERMKMMMRKCNAD